MILQIDTFVFSKCSLFAFFHTGICQSLFQITVSDQYTVNAESTFVICIDIIQMAFILPLHTFRNIRSLYFYICDLIRLSFRCLTLGIGCHTGYHTVAALLLQIHMIIPVSINCCIGSGTDEYTGYCCRCRCSSQRPYFLFLPASSDGFLCVNLFLHFFFYHFTDKIRCLWVLVFQIFQSHLPAASLFCNLFFSFSLALARRFCTAPSEISSISAISLQLKSST